LWLGQRLGLAGIMIANVIPDILGGFIYLFPHACRLLGLPGRQVWHRAVVPALKANIPTLAALILIWVTRPTITWLHFLLSVSVFGMAWAVGAWGMGVLPAERDWLRGYVRRSFSPA
jgi:hypothetical protein